MAQLRRQGDMRQGGSCTTLPPSSACCRQPWSSTLPSSSDRLGASPMNQHNFHVSLTPCHHLSTTFELIYVTITHKRTSVRANRLNVGCFPGTHLTITPAERTDLSALLLPLASLPTNSVLDSQVSHLLLARRHQGSGLPDFNYVWGANR